MGRKTTYDTFWNNLRESLGVSTRDLAEVLGISRGQISNFCTGRRFPTKNNIQKFCDFFDIDYDTGYSEFEKAYQEYHNYPTTESKEPTEDNAAMMDELDKVLFGEDVTEKPTRGLDSVVMRKLYGQVSYDVFFNVIACIADGTGDPLKEIYGKVSYEDYECIRSIIVDDEYPDSTEEIIYPEVIPEFDKWGNVIGMKKREEN